MIIECINCSKKFTVNSDLIPSTGRTIQCGSCNHVWFFDPNNLILESRKKPKIEKKTSITNFVSENKKLKTKPITNKNFSEKNYEITEYKSKSNFSFGKFLSYLLVFIISFIGLIIVIDTFNSPLYELFPNLEIVMFSFFETLKDIQLFIKDLF
tara:strand:- start:248 stop:709 length:462 start_codon:yes stop_codon:yes gene_type:complete